MFTNNVYTFEQVGPGGCKYYIYHEQQYCDGCEHHEECVQYRCRKFGIDVKTMWEDSKPLLEEKIKKLVKRYV